MFTEVLYAIEKLNSHLEGICKDHCSIMFVRCKREEGTETGQVGMRAGGQGTHTKYNLPFSQNWVTVSGAK